MRTQKIFPNEFGELVCTSCLIYKQKTKFYVRTSYKRGYNYTCKECELKHKKERYETISEVREGHKRTELIRLYGKDAYKEYQKLRMNQNFCCAICGIDEDELTRSLQQDHNHETKKKRGLLCHGCNTSLGHFNDSIEILKSAIEYLEQYSNKEKDKS